MFFIIPDLITSLMIKIFYRFTN